MNFNKKIRNAYVWHVRYRIDKIVNTLIWLFSSKDKVLVLNVWLTHRGNRIRPTNLGDDLNYAIVSYLSKKKIISYRHSYISLFKPMNYMCIGSIADTLTNSESIVWGSGAMYGDPQREFVKPKKVLAVRGPLTREYLLSKGVPCPEVFGDPALLLPMIYPCRNVKKKYKMGLIPHYIDFSLDSVRKFKERYEDDVIVIDLAHYKRWQDIVLQINQCEFIASSSLHGIIISEAYHIPVVWIKLSNNVEGNDFKFKDYYESTGRKDMTSIRMIGNDIKIEEIRNNLHPLPIVIDTCSLIRCCPFSS